MSEVPPEFPSNLRFNILGNEELTVKCSVFLFSNVVIVLENRKTSAVIIST